MATTGRPVTELALGIRDTAGAVVASGKARFYNPGTLVAQSIFSDDALTTAITQPLTLNAGGQYKYAYALEAVRMRVHDSTDTTLMYDGIVNLNRADSVYLTVSGVNGGAETTLESVLATAVSSFGAGFQHAVSGQTARDWDDVINERVISVKSFGALGDDSNDDTAEIQAACDYVESLGGGWVYFPKGTYKISSAISIDTAGVKICGAGRGVAIIKNHATSGNSITVNLGSAVDSKIVIQDISLTCNTTTSGAAIVFTNGDKPTVERVTVALHRVGIDTSAVTGAVISGCNVDSTDDNASSRGIDVGSAGRALHCRIVAGTDNGTGLNCAGADSRAVDCYVSNFATGVSLGGAGAQARGLHVSGPTTGISATGAIARAMSCYVTGATTGITGNAAGFVVSDCEVASATTGISLGGVRGIAANCIVGASGTGVSLGAATCRAVNSYVNGATTGFSVGAVAGCVLVGNTVGANTTDLSVDASATALIEYGNGFTTITDTVNIAHASLGKRSIVLSKRTKGTSADAAPTFTPTPTTCSIYVCESTYTAGTPTVTIANTATTGLTDGQILTIIVQKVGANGTSNVTWGAQYLAFTTWAIGTGAYKYIHFQWIAASSNWAEIGLTNVNITGTPW